MSTLTKAAVALRLAKPEDWPLLEQMYAGFDHPGDALGLPPPHPARRHQWLEGLHSGINLVAFCDERAVGHLCLMTSEVVAEMAVFVHQDYRQRGVGWALAEAAVEEARRRGLRSLWVLISSENHAARAGLRAFGFKIVWEKQGEMQLFYRL